MTANDYAAIQRNIGFIEGLVSSCKGIVCNGTIEALNAIEDIINEDNRRITDTDTVHLKLDKEWAEDFLRIFKEVDEEVFKLLDAEKCDMISELMMIIKMKLEDMK